MKTHARCFTTGIRIELIDAFIDHHLADRELTLVDPLDFIQPLEHAVVVVEKFLPAHHVGHPFGDLVDHIVADIFIQNRSENGYDYIYVRYTVKYDFFRRITVPQILNSSLNYLSTPGDQTTKVPQQDANKQPIQKPKPIQDNGDDVTEGTDQKVYYAFGTKNEKDFSTLSLPTALPT